MRIARPWPRKTMDDYTRRRLYLRVGQVIMVAGGIMAVVHWLTHLEAFGPEQPPLWLDLAVGYPMAMLLLVLGGVVASRKPKTRNN
ncbi:hypothetical protein [Microcella frigidaquae]|uniref:DUF3098 domain-containing protein n=1 Tax=Microcella frigidaquae TaxID=424758 RepID=A0A840XQV0_9MICO|nr:hypothetical protein [Microcella frigidaquae]MBB5618309.1 hypothetical protein [Microcella frigidaquae]